MKQAAQTNEFGKANDMRDYVLDSLDLQLFKEALLRPISLIISFSLLIPQAILQVSNEHTIGRWFTNEALIRIIIVRKQLAREKQLTADIILAQRSAVPAIRAKALEQPKKESKHDKQKIEQLAKRKLEGGSLDKPQKKAKATNEKYDLWGEGELYIFPC